MERIRCPHCNAVNQDVEPTDNCWQCDKPLGAPPAPAAVQTPETGVAPSAAQIVAPSLQAPGKPASGSSANSPTLEERVAARKAARKGANPAVPIVVVAVILIVLLILFFVLRR